MAYTFEDMRRDVRKQKFSTGKPTEVGWYVCFDDATPYLPYMRWWNWKMFSVVCTQADAENGVLNREAKCRSAFNVTRWAKPWWPMPHLKGKK